jgi:thiol-disulfide isomerase/thioredoxin
LNNILEQVENERKYIKIFSHSHFESVLFTSCSEIEYANTIDDAFRQARKQDKKVFVIMGANGCGKCDKYLKSLDRSFTAKKVLQRDYICCKLNMNEAYGKEFAMLLGAAFSPYSCFFTSKGELEAFRIGEHDFDFKDITKNKVDDYTFRELFNYTTDYPTYKQQASLAVQSCLWQKEGAVGEQDLSKSYDLIKRSIDIYPNCGNLSLAYQISKEVCPTETTFYKNKIKQVLQVRIIICMETSA